jgi:hypothetical protein
MNDKHRSEFPVAPLLLASTQRKTLRRTQGMNDLHCATLGFLLKLLIAYYIIYLRSSLKTAHFGKFSPRKIVK